MEWLFECIILTQIQSSNFRYMFFYKQQSYEGPNVKNGLKVKQLSKQR